MSRLSVCYINLCSLLLALACQSAPLGSDQNDADQGASLRCLTDLPREYGIVLQQMNILRSNRRSSLIVKDEELMRVAALQASAMAEAGRVDHRVMDDTLLNRLGERGIVRRYAAENLARFEDREDPARYLIRFWWLHGDQESENLVMRQYTRMGVALAGDAANCYAVLILTD